MKTHIVWLSISVAALIIGMHFSKKEIHVAEKSVGIVKTKEVPVEKPAEVANEVPKENEPHADRVSIRKRTELYAWMKRHGTYLSGSPFNEETFDRHMAIVLGLQPSEVERLDAAVKRAKMQLDEAARRAATGQASEDGKTLRVTVPSLLVEGGAIYTGLLTTVKEVLGEDRFTLFSDLSGDRIDTSYDRFGLNPIVYELTLQPSGGEGPTSRYSLKRSWVNAEKESSYGSGSVTTSREDIEKEYPALARFLPPDFGK